MKTVVPAWEVLILAPGDSQGAKNNARGELFEAFIAQLMAHFGYERPTRENLNSTANGVEIDVTATHVMSRHRAIAECKAHSTALSAKELNAFYGKLQGERFADVSVFGYFIALPRLTEPAREVQARNEARDDRFRVYTAETLIELLLDRNVIDAFAAVVAAHGMAGALLSDEALLVTSHGLFYAAHELSESTRLPTRVVIFVAKIGESIPSKVAELLAEQSSYTKGLPCQAATSIGAIRVQRAAASEDTIIEVTGSSSDFDYQFPAAPKYFVGRQSYIANGEVLLRSVGGDGTRGHVIVLNAQSGWGKSSLALRILSIARGLGGDGLCIDCRTANQATFVSTALRHALLKAQSAGLLTLPETASFATVASSVQTLRSSTFFGGPLCIFFDQFENVFQNSALTREFRDLALAVVDVQAPLIIGFSWKTDFVAFTESYPYQLRDDIRSHATVLSLAPFGAAEIGELIRRLQRACGQKIHQYVRERIREYSQGLPWLFKKLASHIIREIENGTTQDELLAEVLNIQTLFESDISGLQVHERQALKAIARRAPLAVVEAVELAGGDKAVQSLLNQRLLVSIGEKLDVYWDVFRDYLNQGSVPLQESYILRLTPNSVAKLLATIKESGGVTTADAAAKSLETSTISVHNMARDLRQLGILAAQERVLRFSDDIASAADLNAAIIARSAAALRRHRVFSLLSQLAPVGSKHNLSLFADELPKAYPAVDAKRHTWANYARAFAYWFRYAGLATIEGDEISLGASQEPVADLTAPQAKRRPLGRLFVFPHSNVGPVLRLLGQVSARRQIADSSTVRKAVADATAIGLVAVAADKRLVLTESGAAIVAAEGGARALLVRAAIEALPAYRVTLPLLLQDPGCSAQTIGRRLAGEVKAEWSDRTAQWIGKLIRSWMRAAGVDTVPRTGSNLSAKPSVKGSQGRVATSR